MACSRRSNNKCIYIFVIKKNTNIRLGDSIAVNGACLTVVLLTDDTFAVNLSPETNRRTNLGCLQMSDPVNLERSLTYGGRIGGHLVQGHVDGTGMVRSITPENDTFLFSFEVSPSLMRYIVEKGFIAVDGISLTIVERHPTEFIVSVIPYTYSYTVLGSTL